MIKEFLGRVKKHFLGKREFQVNKSDFWDKSLLIRLGTEYGGWYIPKQLSLIDTDNCYLAGAGEDISFDCELAKRFSCNICIFDPTPKALIHFNNLTKAIESQELFAINNTAKYYDISSTDFQKIHFYPWGVAGENSRLKFFMPNNPDHVSCSVLNLQGTKEFFEADCYTISTICEKLSHSNVTLLKLDIEGAEYQVIHNLISMNNLPYLLLIEFDELHTPLDNGAYDRVHKHIELLKSKGMKHIFMDGANATFIRS